MTAQSDDQAREWQYFGQVIDPLVRDVLTCTDPWDAYRLVLEVCSLMTDTSPGGSWSLPHAGGVYVAWAELTDLFETGKTPIPDAYATMRRAAMKWLNRPAESTPAFIEKWTSEVSEAVGALFERDGNWWRDPH